MTITPQSDKRLRWYVRTITKPHLHEGRKFCVWCGIPRPKEAYHV